MAVALRSAAGPAPAVERRESNAAAALRYAAIGAAATATGVAVAVTAGVAAPALAVALGGSTVWGASSVATFATTYSLFFAAGFGAAGCGPCRVSYFKTCSRPHGLRDRASLSVEIKFRGAFSRHRRDACRWRCR